MGLFNIIQYEVHVLEEGHWSVRARYPRSDRDHAFTEARRIDLNENCAARVVRDVYDPDSGRSQEFTVFLSDRAKTAKPHARGPQRSRAQTHRGPKQKARLRAVRSAPLGFRITMAIGVGIITALLITAIATWALAPQQESFASVLSRSPAPGHAMTLFIAVVLFSVFTLLRGPLGISRLARAVSAHFGTHTGMPRAATAVSGVEQEMSRAEPVPRPPEAADEDTHLLALSRIMLARFFTETAPANAQKALEDSLGLRGLALFLGGAASELAAMLEMPSAADLVTQISPGILQDAVKEVLADIRAIGRADAVLVAAGLTAMRKYATTPGEQVSMASALVAWHKAVRAENPLADMESPPRAK